MESFALLEVIDIIADILTKQGSKMEMLEEVIKEGRFENALDVNNLVRYADGKVSIRNLTTKGAKDK